MCLDCILYFILFYCLQNSLKHVNHSSQLKTVTKFFFKDGIAKLRIFLFSFFLISKCYQKSVILYQHFATFYGILYFCRFHDIVFLFLFSIIQVLLWFNQLTDKEILYRFYNSRSIFFFFKIFVLVIGLLGKWYISDRVLFFF